MASETFIYIIIYGLNKMCEKRRLTVPLSAPYIFSGTLTGQAAFDKLELKI